MSKGVVLHVRDLLTVLGFCMFPCSKASWCPAPVQSMCPLLCPLHNFLRYRNECKWSQPTSSLNRLDNLNATCAQSRFYKLCVWIGCYFKKKQKEVHNSYNNAVRIAGSLLKNHCDYYITSAQLYHNNSRTMKQQPFQWLADRKYSDT